MIYSGRLISDEAAQPLVSSERSIAALLDSAFDYIFYALIFATIFFLSGSIYGVNFYMPLFLLVLPLGVHSLFRRHLADAPYLALTLCVLILLSAWMIIGLCNNFEFAGIKSQFTEILFTFSTCWLIYIFSEREYLRRLRFLRLVLASVVASAVMKLGIILYAVTHGIPVMEMVLLLDKIFGSDIMTMSLGDLFGRIQFAADALIPVCVFMVLRHRERLGLGSLRASLTILILVVSVLFSFSRYYWAFTALAFVLGLVLGKRDKFQAILTTIMGITTLASLPALVALYELRFSDVVAGGSDIERAEQIPALQKFFWDSPWIGHGLGSYTTQMVRATEAGRHNYELQILALLGQVGMIGVLGLVILLLWYVNRLWLKGSLSRRDRVGIALLLSAWIAGGFSNPLLFNPLAGVVYASLSTLSALEIEPAGSRLPE